MKKFFRTIHLYLALAAGVFIMISCITGTILVFEDEIGNVLKRDMYFVKPGDTRLPLATLAEQAKHSVEKSKPAFIKIYAAADRAVEVGLIVPQTHESNKAGRRDTTSNKEQNHADGEQEGQAAPPSKPRPGLSVFVNPYTGAITGSYSKATSFFHTVEMLHRFLLGGNNSIGKKIMGISAFFFLFIVITGIILWWPKTKKILLQRLKYKWDGNLRRLNHDIHIVSGFYTSIFLLIIILSGLMMAHPWMGNSVYFFTGTKPAQPKQGSSSWKKSAITVSEDTILKLVSKQEHAEYFNIRIPQDSASAYSVNVLPKGSLEPAINTYLYDQYTAALTGVRKFQDNNTGQKLHAYIKPVHTGELYGLPTKILSFIVCLMAMTFPVTGIIMWLNRTRVKKPL